ncbi:hypothetical protein MJO28_009770 [Puccinia striiformis f. sp. tritici]|uniref:Uncharacterized protein n=1 Tax=Puccinia striiformis f. sp. tritici TaxID=168172 RepID=A0ACC0E8K9_9BASI|nr:hypothetical protein MJO28_009770 [Puccinia striiformis f. sp. tritici]
MCYALIPAPTGHQDAQTTQTCQYPCCHSPKSPCQGAARHFGQSKGSSSGTVEADQEQGTTLTARFPHITLVHQSTVADCLSMLSFSCSLVGDMLPSDLAKAGRPAQKDTPIPRLEEDLDFLSFDPPLSTHPEPAANDTAQLNVSMIGPQAPALPNRMGNVNEDDWDDVQDNQNEGHNVAHPSVAYSKCGKLPDNILRRLEDMELDKLCSRCLKHGQYQRPSAEEKVELDNTYYKYMKTIHRNACKHLLRTQAVLGYLGQCNCAQGSTMYNNFCQYDLGARKFNTNSESKPSSTSTSGQISNHNLPKLSWQDSGHASWAYSGKHLMKLLNSSSRILLFLLCCQIRSRNWKQRTPPRLRECNSSSNREKTGTKGSQTQQV